MKRDKISNEKIIEVLKNNKGLMAKTAKALNISSRTLRMWASDDPDLKAEIDNCIEDMIDESESKLYEQIEGNDTTAIIFHLKTKGKHRGYVERQENAIHIEQPLFEDDDDDDDGNFDD